MERPYTDSSELERRSRIINIVTRALLTFEPYHTKLQNDSYSPVRTVIHTMKLLSSSVPNDFFMNVNRFSRSLILFGIEVCFNYGLQGSQ